MADETQTVIDATANAATQAVEAAGRGRQGGGHDRREVVQAYCRDCGQDHEADGKGRSLDRENPAPRQAAPREEGDRGS